jgi:hyaluronan synthase
VVNDGSTDGTGREIDRLAAEHPRIRAIHFPENRGKRAAMAAGIRASDAEVLIFVDSDSVVERDAVRIVVQPFADPGVGAVCGHADVANIDEGWLAKMQAVRYYIAFRVLKGAESVFGAVTCCSGCFAAYRRKAIMPDLQRWEEQTFLGRPATLGDDRSLTNIVLRNWSVLYESRAIARTIVPATMQKFLHQQIRWKRSWTREGFILSRFAWRKHPVAAISIYTNIVIAFVSPATAMRAIVLHPLLTGVRPFVFILGLYAVSVMYGLFFQALVPRRDALWAYALHFVFFYVGILIWQNYWALITLTRSHWGTRPTSHHGADTIDAHSDEPARTDEALARAA